jgi:hypothetical protein
MEGLRFLAIVQTFCRSRAQQFQQVGIGIGGDSTLHVAGHTHLWRCPNAQRLVDRCALVGSHHDPPPELEAMLATEH